MRAVIWLIAIFALAVGLAMVAGVNDGYVLFVLPPWRAQLTLNFVIVLLLLGFLSGYLLLRVVRRTLDLPERVSQWRDRRRREKAGRALREALAAMCAGRFSQALKSASNAFSSGESPAMAALVAARAAHALQDDARYRMWLGHAADQGEEARVARLMTEAELAVEGRRFDEAAERLAALRASGQKHIAVLRLESKVAAALGRWDEVVRIARQLRKHKAFTEEQAAPLLRRGHIERMRQLAGDGAAMAAYWNEIPAAELKDRRLIERVVPLLAAAGQGALARRHIERLLDEEWDSALARQYGNCGDGEGDARACLQKAEAWLQLQPRDGGLLFALGRLCIGAQLWGKAQSYLEASLNQSPAVETHLALAHLLEQLGRAAEAQKHYRSAAERVAGSPSA